MLAIWTTFYGVFGILKLGVILDLGLIVAATGLGLLAIENGRQSDSTRRTAALAG